MHFPNRQCQRLNQGQGHRPVMLKQVDRLFHFAILHAFIRTCSSSSYADTMHKTSQTDTALTFRWTGRRARKKSITEQKHILAVLDMQIC